MSKIRVRNEKESDCTIISEVITLAFKNDPHGDGREAEIVELMREDSALSISLVAEVDNKSRAYRLFKSHY